MELNKAELPWTRHAARVGEIGDEDVQISRKFLGILNKLTPQKLQSLAEQAQSLDITTKERLSGCIDQIFNKVCVCVHAVRLVL